MRYRYKPIVIEAIIWNENNLKEVMEFIGSEFEYEKNTEYATDKFVYFDTVKRLFLHTLEGMLEVSKGDYIIKDIQGEFSPCNPDVFKQTYEEIVD